ncbi:MAG TPA: acyl-CoA dehydratase activase [Dermatophilaceae bacterium]|jgi:predicted CoA-substrate-specific enzyme activase|nr:acyl-CoA dehydratase activase [Dermatophilaceae bacterium]
MTITAGIDVGGAYTKVVLLDDELIIGRAILRTGYKPGMAAEECLGSALADAGIGRDRLDYVVATGFGRFQVAFSQLNVTELTAAAWGAHALFPGTKTILDVGGHAVKASRIDESRQVKSFRLNEKCAAGTGAFLEKTARYMGFNADQIGALAATSSIVVPISGVCTVFAEAEVINHLSQGIAAADIMNGAIASLVGKSVQLMKRVKMEPEVTLIGGIMRFPTMVSAIRETVPGDINVPEGDLVQFVAALGAGALAQHQVHRLAEQGAPAAGRADLVGAGAS